MTKIKTAGDSELLTASARKEKTCGTMITPLHIPGTFSTNLKKKINGFGLYEMSSLHASTVPTVLLCKLGRSMVCVAGAVC